MVHVHPELEGKLTLRAEVNQQVETSTAPGGYPQAPPWNRCPWGDYRVDSLGKIRWKTKVEDA